MNTKTIAYLTDAHLGQKVVFEGVIGSSKMSYHFEPDEHKNNVKSIFDDIIKRGITEVVFGGDIGTGETIKWFFDLINTYKFKLSTVLGNHDTFAEVAKYYKNDFVEGENEMNYAHEDTYLKYIYLDSSANTVSTIQQNWLEEELKTTKKVVLFIHHPVLDIDTPLDKIGAALKGKDQLKDLLQESGKDITIFCGHYHMDDENTDKNIRQFLTPAASYQIDKQAETVIVNQKTFGYRLIEINKDLITSQAVTFLIF